MSFAGGTSHEITLNIGDKELGISSVTVSGWVPVIPVSYTHLDVYKRQRLYGVGMCGLRITDLRIPEMKLYWNR